jgi:hypothetical protein
MEFVTFKNSSKPKGVAYVRFQQPEDCKSALEYLHPKEDESQEEAKGDGKERCGWKGEEIGFKKDSEDSESTTQMICTPATGQPVVVKDTSANKVQFPK